MGIRVDGELIPQEAIDFELSRLVQYYSQHMPNEELKKNIEIFRARATDQAIGAKLLIKEAARLDLKVSPAEIDERLNAMIAHVGGREKFDDLLKKQNLTEESIREGIERGKKVDKLVEKVTAGIKDPTEEEMQEYYDSHSAEYMKDDSAQAQHILIKVDSKDASEKEKALVKINEIRQKIIDGADFAEQAAAHSDCPSGKRMGGSLGWFSRGMMVPEFDKKVFSMNIGDISEAIETRFGYHIIKKTGQENGGPAEFVEVKEKIRDLLRHAKRGGVLTDYVSELKAKAQIVFE